MDPVFSVIMAVYNVEPFLREAVESLIEQDFGFDRVQLILVDDGSSDGSGAICDEYSARYGNITVIHKKNGGVSSARNTGLALAEGRYVNFMDSDDRLSPSTLSRVSAFFEEHSGETDVVSVPFRYFDGRTGEHVLNYKYKSGERVINLKREWDAAQLSCSSAFFRREAIGDTRFDERLRYMEDAKFIHVVLSGKETLGVVPGGEYLYRRRTEGERSAGQLAVENRQWYLPRIEYYFEDTIRYFLSRNSCIPKYVQFVMMYDIQWILAMEDLPAGVLSEREDAEYRSRLLALLKYIDDDVVLAQRNIHIEQKMFSLRKKNGQPPELRYLPGNAEILFGGNPVGTLSSRRPKIDFIRMEDSLLTVEGRFSVYPLPGVVVKVAAEFCGVRFQGELRAEDRHVFSLGEQILDFYSFRFQIPVSGDVPGGELCIGMELDGHLILPDRVEFGSFSGLSAQFKNAYYIQSGWCVQYIHPNLSFRRADSREKRRRELAFLWELLFGKNKRSLRGFAFRAARQILLSCKRRPLWLISERESAAGDNGEAFFRYMAAEHPEIDARFVLLKDSPDYEKLSKVGRLVRADSVMRKLLSLICDFQISSQAEWISFDPFYPKDAPFRDILASRRFVFLQHGITQNDVSYWLRKDQRNIFGFITAAVPEYESILSGNYGYTEKEVWLTGFPRFDQLTADPDPHFITIMPTWRKYLMGEIDPKTEQWTLAPGFRESDFYIFYNSLITDSRLIKAAEEHGYRIMFFPHPNLRPYISQFEKREAVVFPDKEMTYRDIYARSAMIVTDYSSAVFDFAWLRRPVVYAQFDAEKFYGGSHGLRKGWFDCGRDGFGEVEYDLERTVGRIIEYIENGCRLKDEYRERADRFFAFDDRDNCRRVYERLIEAGPVRET